MEFRILGIKMSKLILVNFDKFKLDNYSSNIDEICAKFDAKMAVNDNDNEISLHTEFCGGGSRFSNTLFDKEGCYQELKSQTEEVYYRNGNCYIHFPLLWISKEWSIEFAEYILEFCQKIKKTPKVIEIHPPFKDKINLDEFLIHYEFFEKIILQKFHNVNILIENRTGTLYSNIETLKNESPFLISRVEDLVELSNKIRLKDLRLKITLDLPQLLNSHKIGYSTPQKLKKDIHEIMRSIKLINHHIKGLHLWGYGTEIKSDGEKRYHVAHFAGFEGIIKYVNLPIEGQNVILRYLVRALHDCQNENEYYLVPEIFKKLNGKDILNKLMLQLEESGFKF